MNTKKTLICATALLLSMQTLMADSFQRAVPPERYTVSVAGLYGWNPTWQSYGGFDLNGHMPINKYFETDAAFEYHSPSACAIGAVARPKFPLKTGELFLDGAIHARFLCKYGSAQVTTSASFGYRMDYVSAQVGFSHIFLYDMKRSPGSEDENISEPFNLLYRLCINVRPRTCLWNIGFGIANYTEYEYERTWQPIYFIGGHYDFHKNLSANLRADFKPSGTFHMNAQFWGVCVRAGISYLF